MQYATRTQSIPKGVLPKGSKVILFDECVSTGGTAKACKELVEREGSEVIAIVYFFTLDEFRDQALKALKGEKLIGVF